MPTIGLGALNEQASEADLFDTDKEKTMFRPRDRTWRDIGEESAMEGVGINMVLAPSKFIDIGSIGMLPYMKVKLWLNSVRRYRCLNIGRRNFLSSALRPRTG
jgi:hypothetical protein